MKFFTIYTSAEAKARAQELGIDAEYIVDNCEKTKLNDNSFDIVYGSGILHHLKIEKCLDEINRILVKNGQAFITVPGLHTFSFLDMGNFKFIFPIYRR